MKTYKSNSLEISLKRKKSDYKKIKISCSKDAEKYARQFYHEDLTIYESFFIILLNQSNNTIGYAKISQGGVTGTVVDPQIVAKFAIESLSKSIILVHNHPSGSLIASESDKKVTNKINKVLNLFDCRVLDHIILTEDDYLSFGDQCIL
jgi:DNA repair protein RadC